MGRVRKEKEPADSAAVKRGRGYLRGFKGREGGFLRFGLWGKKTVEGHKYGLEVSPAPEPAETAFFASYGGGNLLFSGFERAQGRRQPPRQRGKQGCSGSSDRP